MKLQEGTVKVHCPRCKSDTQHEQFNGTLAGENTAAVRCTKCRLTHGHPGAEAPPRSPARMGL